MDSDNYSKINHRYIKDNEVLSMGMVVKLFQDLSIYELYEIMKIRSSVFVVEQNCVYQDLDDKDKLAYHVFLKEDEGIQAYLRVLPKDISFEDVSIGRVLTIKRGQGLGYKILLEGIKVAKDRLKADKIKIEAQLYAKEFYERVGFKQISDDFLEDGIPHILMELCDITNN